MSNTDITRLLPPKTTVPTPQRMANRGIVTIPPTGLTDDTLTVVLPSYSPDYGWPCRWIRQGSTLPAIGAECLVLWDETAAGTVVQWAGAGVATECRGRATATGVGSQLADIEVTDNLGTAAKMAVAIQHVGGTFMTDAVVFTVSATTLNTTTLRAFTRLGGNITVGQTVLIDYLIWR